MNVKFRIIFVIVLSISVYACTKKSDETSPVTVVNTGPLLPEQPYDYLSDQNLQNNGFPFNIRLSNNIITLGRVLFYDKTLSFNNNISCGSCHFQDKGFADNVRFHKGVYGNTLKRNTIAISGNGGAMFWDGRSNNMRDLVLKPIANHDEMLQDPQALVNKVKQIPYYKNLFSKAYNEDVIDLEKIENALTAFCVALLPNNTKFNAGLQTIINDPFQFTNLDSTSRFGSFSAIENKGMALFFGKARCGTCHHPQEGGNTYGNGSISSFANIGLDLNYSDNGVGILSNNSLLYGVFKIPNLKNVALTAPYMHDGRFNTLEEVVEHYNSGIKANTNLSPKLFKKQLSQSELEMLEFQPPVVTNTAVVPAKLGLTQDEKLALVAFLKTLTDEKLARDIKFSNPF